jgi:hypothetical protein
MDSRTSRGTYNGTAWTGGTDMFLWTFQFLVWNNVVSICSVRRRRVPTVMTIGSDAQHGEATSFMRAKALLNDFKIVLSNSLLRRLSQVFIAVGS